MAKDKQGAPAVKAAAARVKEAKAALKRAKKDLKKARKAAAKRKKEEKPSTQAKKPKGARPKAVSKARIATPRRSRARKAVPDVATREGDTFDVGESDL